MSTRKRELVLLQETDENACVGNAINKALYNRKISQTDFAKKIFASNKSVHEWTKGKKLPMSDKWPDIKELLGVDICEEILQFRRRKQRMNNKTGYPDIYSVNCITEAKAVTETICANCGIDRYHIAVVESCKWLLMAVMGLTYSKYFTMGYGEPDWFMFRDSLESYLSFDGDIEAEFEELSLNLIEDDEIYEDSNKEFLEDTLHYWHLFNRAVKRKESCVYDELVVAISKIVDSM